MDEVITDVGGSSRKTSFAVKAPLVSSSYEGDVAIRQRGSLAPGVVPSDMSRSNRSGGSGMGRNRSPKPPPAKVSIIFQSFMNKL
jgi:hypothetical protein